MSFPRYPQYKPSGVEWLGEVPAHWRWGRLRYLTSELVDGTHHSPASFPSGDRLYITAKNIKEAGVDLTDVSYVSEEIHEEIYSRCPVLTGDVLYIKDGATAGVATVNQLAEPFSLLSSVALLRPAAKHIEARYLAYMLNGSSFKQDALNRVVGGAMTRLTLDMISRFVVSLPPLPEQQAIAEFLDRETTKIDLLIAEQERLIELLQEKRQAVISHAVTKGLDPSAPMRPSGVDWLGDVPAHWEVVRLKGLIREQLRYGANEASDCDTPGWPRFVRITDVDEAGGLRTDTFRSLPPETAAPYLLEEGDVLLARSGATVGKSFLYSPTWGTACFAGYLIRARLDVTRCLADWFYKFCQTGAYWAHVIGTQIQTTIQNVSAERYAALLVPVPPVQEQRAIAAFLDRETTKIDLLIAESKSAITLLAARRSALISAAVTGQIDVRNAVATEAA